MARKFLLLFCGLWSILAFAQEGDVKTTDEAVFAGGCFWCMQPPFDKTPGVLSTTAGYAGGKKPNPTYEEVSAGGTGYIESIKVTYDPSKVTYAQLLDVYWHNVDPLDPKGQFCDKGDQYVSVIFYGDEPQKDLAEKSLLQIQQKLNGQTIYTQIRPLTTFYPAEEYHQDYSEKNPVHYKMYKIGSGREGYLKRLWGNKKN